MNAYFERKGLTNLNHFNAHTWLGETTSILAEIKGKFVARELYHLDNGQVGYERIFLKDTQKRPTFSRGYQGEKSPLFTPIHNIDLTIETTHKIYVVGGYADAITIANAIDMTNTLVLGLQGEANAPNLIQQLRIKYPNAQLIAALDGDNAGRKAAVKSNCDWVTPENGDWNDLYLKNGLSSVHNAINKINPPVPDFDIWAVPRVDLDLFKTKKERFEALSSITDYEVVASFAMSLTLKYQSDVPTRYSEHQFIEKLVTCNHRLSYGTCEALKEQLQRFTKEVKETALSLITMSKEAKLKHSYRKVKDLKDIGKLGDGVHLLSAGHGVGKTTNVGIPFVKNAIGHTLALCHLQSLTADLAYRFNIEHYKKYAESLNEIRGMSGQNTPHTLDNRKKVAICLNSIVLTLSEWVKQSETIFIDEVAQVLNVLATAEYKGFNREDVYNQLVTIIGKAKQILVMDADLDDSVISFLEQARPNETFNIYEQPRQSTDYDVEWIYGSNEKETAEHAASKRVLALLQQDKKLIIATDSKAKAINLDCLIKSAFKTKRVLTIHSSTTESTKVKEFLANPTKFAPIYDVVIHSPSMRSGVSIECDHFDIGVGVFCGKTITPQDSIQMLRRARNLKHWVVAVDEPHNSNIEDAYILRDAQEKADLRSSSNKFMADDLTHFDLFVNEQKAKENKSKNMFSQALYFQLQAYKFKVTHCSEREETESILADIKAHNKELYNEALLNASYVSEFEIERLNNQVEKTLQEVATLEAASIKQWSGSDIIDQDLIKLWDFGKGIHRLEALNTIKSGSLVDDSTSELSISLRAFKSVRINELKTILSMTNIDLNTLDGSITLDQEKDILDYIWANKTLLAYLNIIPSRFAVSSDKPKTAKKLINPILAKVGISLRTKSTSIRQEGKNISIRVLAVDSTKMVLISTILSNKMYRSSQDTLKRISGTAVQIDKIDIPQLETNPPVITEIKHIQIDDLPMIALPFLKLDRAESDMRRIYGS